MYADVLILLIFAVVLVAIFRRLGQPVILAYLFAGMLLGPHGVAIVTGQAMMQTIGAWHRVPDVLPRARVLPAASARHAQAGAGGRQPAEVLLTSLLFFGLGWWGLSLAQALVVSGTLALSKQWKNQLEKYREEVQDVVRLGEPGWKTRYYTDKMKAEDIEHGGGREKVFHAYIEGLCWVMKYYYSGCASWQWFYPFHYAPFASDLRNIDRFTIKFDEGIPFRPFEQLMGVFPAEVAMLFQRDSVG